jgi:hypothetical protein
LSYNETKNLTNKWGNIYLEWNDEWYNHQLYIAIFWLFNIHFENIKKEKRKEKKFKQEQ